MVYYGKQDMQRQSTIVGKRLYIWSKKERYKIAGYTNLPEIHLVCGAVEMKPSITNKQAIFKSTCVTLDVSPNAVNNASYN